LLKFKVNEFSIGFGKVLYQHKSKRTGELFSIRLIPLGGYCSFEGEDEAGSAFTGGGRDKVGFEEKLQHRSNAGEIPYDKQKPWKRLIVLFAGAFANFICGIVFCFILLTTVGYYQNVKITKVETSPSWHLSGVIQEGDIITEINGEKMSLLKNYTSRISKFDEGEKFTLTIIRDGVVISKEISKERITTTDGVKYTGIGIGGEIQYQKMSIGKSCGKAFSFAWELAILILGFLGKMVTGKIGWDEMGGTFSTISVMSEAISYGLVNLLILIPLISINLAVFNLLPIPALDGARMVFVVVEWLRGKPVNPALENRIHTIGLIILLGLVLILDLNYLVFSRF
jgi:regulator of sigma E protease